MANENWFGTFLQEMEKAASQRGC